ncbi:MAG: AfsR/SARP family transcriptional regulator [Candidatus Limnocylindria bacterium]
MSGPLPQQEGTRIQLCGRFAARVAGRRIDRELPGRQGRLLFAYLAANRDRVASRDELAEALWPRGLPSAPDRALSALLSKLRRLLPDGALEGHSAIRLELGGHARVDLEAARDGIHRAEALIAARDWYASIGPTLVAHNIGQRRFLPSEEGAWIEEPRRELQDIQVRALECTARRSLGIGGAEVAVAERTARRLIDLSPYRESAYALLMQAFERQGNIAEALRVYESLRGLLREELGAAPSPTVQQMHERLLTHQSVG